MVKPYLFLTLAAAVGMSLVLLSRGRGHNLTHSDGEEWAAREYVADGLSSSRYAG